MSKVKDAFAYDPDPEQEVWKPVVGYEGIYEVSNFGRVLSLDRLVPLRNNAIRPTKGRIITPCLKPNGYLYITLKRDGRQKMRFVHRLVAQHFLDNPDNKPEVNHIDFDKTNNKADNLEWCSKSENALHNILHNKARQRLTKEDVLEIRRRKTSGESCKAVYDSYKERVSFSAFAKAYRGYTWRYLEAER